MGLDDKFNNLTKGDQAKEDALAIQQIVRAVQAREVQGVQAREARGFYKRVMRNIQVERH